MKYITVSLCGNGFCEDPTTAENFCGGNHREINRTEVEYAKSKLEDFQRLSKVIYRSPGSYSLKHLFERDLQAENDGVGYVSNGALLQAAFELGLLVKQDGPNGLIGISVTQLRVARDSRKQKLG